MNEIFGLKRDVFFILESNGRPELGGRMRREMQDRSGKKFRVIRIKWEMCKWFPFRILCEVSHSHVRYYI